MGRTLNITSKQIAVAAVIAILVLVVFTWRWRVAEEERRAEEIATAEGLAQIVSSTFEGRSDLRVSSIRGTIDVTSVNRGTIFDSTLRATLPYSVDYFVDLSGLDAAKTHYDPQSQTLVVDIPDIRISTPNVDLTKGRVGDAEGFWVSRRASANLVNRALKLTREKASQNALEAENVERARREARLRTAALLEVPLKAAGFGDVSIAIRFPSEATRDRPTYMDRSTPYNEAIEEARRRRAAEE